VSSDIQLIDALEEMETAGIFGMGVVNGDGVLIGTLTAMSLKENIMEFTAKLLEMPVGEYIEADGRGYRDREEAISSTCQFGDPFLDVFKKMAKLHCQMLHIVDDDGRPTAVIRLQDAIEAAIQHHCDVPAEVVQSWDDAAQEAQFKARRLCDISLLEESGIIQAAHVHTIWCFLPGRVRHRNWRLLYSTATHGCSIDSFYRYQAITDEPVVILIKEMGGDRVFGAYTTESWSIHDRPFGQGDSFTFSFTASSHDYDTDIEVHKWTKANDTFMIANKDSFSLGAGGDGPALRLDRALLNGSSNACATFGNKILASKSEFKIKVCEVWGLGWQKLREVRSGPEESLFS